MRVQIGNPNPRQDQKAAVGGQFQGRRAPRQGCYRSVFKESELLESMSQKWPITQIVMLTDPSIPQRLPTRATDRFDGGWAKVIQLSGDRIRVGGSLKRRQDNVWFLELLHAYHGGAVDGEQIHGSGKSHFKAD